MKSVFPLDWKIVDKQDFYMPFKRERASLDLFNEMAPLTVAHAKETGTKLPDPDLQTYLGMGSNGSLAIFTLRDDQGTLQGYAFWILGEDPKHRGRSLAICDMIYVAKPFRNAGGFFMRFCVDNLREEHVDEFDVFVNEKVDFSPLLRALGFEKTATTYTLKEQVLCPR